MLVGDPANREKNREFFDFRRPSRLRWLTRPIISVTWSQIPYSIKQGISSAEQGILPQEQGILPFKTEIIAGWGFRYTQGGRSIRLGFGSGVTMYASLCSGRADCRDRSLAGVPPPRWRNRPG